ncbi:MAG: VWA domain-containing protein [Myxococcota bacterium]
MPKIQRFLSLVAAGLALACTPVETSDPPSQEQEAAPVAVRGDETKDVDPDTSPRAYGPVSAVVLPQRSILAGQGGTLDVMIRLEGLGEAGPRPPLDLAMVLDRSGSMGGEKIIAVKGAAISMLGELNDADHVTLVAYASEVENHGRRLADRAGKAFTRKQLLAIDATTGTALGPALFDGLAALGAAKRDDEVLAHVLLLSDGQANEGETDPAVIAAKARDAFARGISTSTLGVGLDYNEDLMTKIADAGGGRYHFIENSDAIQRVLSEEMAGVAATVARGIELEIRPTTGVEVDTVFGYENTRDGAKVGALVGSLAAGQKRAILARITYPPTDASSLPLGEFHVRFVDAETGAAGELVLRPEVDVVATDAEVTKSENIEVTVRAAELQANEQLRAAALAVERRDFAEAEKTIGEALQSLRDQNDATPSADLVQQIDEFEGALKEVDEAKTDRVKFKRSSKKMKSKVYRKGKK